MTKAEGIYATVLDLLEARSTLRGTMSAKNSPEYLKLLQSAVISLWPYYFSEPYDTQYDKL